MGSAGIKVPSQGSSGEGLTTAFVSGSLRSPGRRTESARPEPVSRKDFGTHFGPGEDCKVDLFPETEVLTSDHRTGRVTSQGADRVPA